MEISASQKSDADCAQLTFMGDQKAKAGDYENAVKLYSQAARLSPNDHRIFGNRSLYYLHMNAFDLAMEDAKRFITLQPTSPKGYFRIGCALLGKKKHEFAAQAFKKALSVDKDIVDEKHEFAAQAFEKALSVDKDIVDEVRPWLMRARIGVLVDMDIPEVDARRAVIQHKTVEEALESLFNNAGANSQPSLEAMFEREVYISDDDEDEFCDSNKENMGANTSAPPKSCAPAKAPITTAKAPPTPVKTTAALVASPAKAPIVAPSTSTAPIANFHFPSGPFSQTSDVPPRFANRQPAPPAAPRTAAPAPAARKLSNASSYADDDEYDIQEDPTNPLKCVSLFVGNITHQATYKQMQKLFSKWGKIEHISLLPEKKCAFIDYSKYQEAGEAMKKMQNQAINGVAVKIRYSNRPKQQQGGVYPALVLRKDSLPNGQQPKPATAPANKTPILPVNGNECYWWRKRGYCTYEEQCRFKHVKANKVYEVVVPHKVAGALIGNGGERIATIREETGARITIYNEKDSLERQIPAGERLIWVTGTTKQIEKAEYLMQKTIRDHMNL